MCRINGMLGARRAGEGSIAIGTKTIQEAHRGGCTHACYKGGQVIMFWAFCSIPELHGPQ